MHRDSAQIKRREGGRPKPFALAKISVSWGSGLSDDVDDLAATTRTELNIAGGGGEQGVVVTATHIVAGVEVGTALANDDLTGVDELTTETLDTEALRVGVTAVAGGTQTLLVCHVRLLSLELRTDSHPARSQELT